MPLQRHAFSGAGYRIEQQDRDVVDELTYWCYAIETHGAALAEVARQLGVSTSALSQIIKRTS
jgi:hypothetical protein